MGKEITSCSMTLLMSIIAVLLLTGAEGQVPTWAPTTSMWPTGSAIPTGSAYPTSTWYPTGTPLPTITTFPSASPPSTLLAEAQVTDPPSVTSSSPPSSEPSSQPVEAPTGAPQMAPTAPPSEGELEIATALPTGTPTSTPATQPPTLMPVTSAPVPIPVPPTNMPTNVPVATTATPTTFPTVSPTAATTLPPTTSPVAATVAPTVNPTSTPTISPTGAPSLAPGTPVNAIVEGIRLTLVNCVALPTQDLLTWESVTNAWFSNFYANADERPTSVRNVVGFVSLQSQEEFLNADNIPVVVLTYSQRLQYEEVNSNTAPSPSEMATLPFRFPAGNFAYGQQLRESFPESFGDLESPIQIPIVTGPSEAPTGSPTAAPVTAGPSDAPSLQPSFAQTLSPSTAAPVDQTLSPSTAAPVQTVAPTESTTAAPTRGPGTAVDKALRGITLEFVGADMIAETDVEDFEATMAEWFSGYFLSARRRLQADRDLVQDMATTFTVLDQSVVTSNGIQTNTVTYDQFLTYVAQEGADDPEDYAVLPFEDAMSSSELGLRLQQEFDSFENLRLPLETPSVPDQTVPPSGDDGDGLGTGAIAGIAVGGAVVLLGLGFFGYNQMRGRGDYDDSRDQKPPTHFNVSADEDISTMDEPHMSKIADQQSLTGGYGDQSVATVDYDYTKAYGGGDTSVVSSAGGTMGDATRQTGEVTGAGAAATNLALGAETTFGETGLGTNDEVMEIFAPAGKLGVVIDTPDDGAPVVHAVKDSSVIADQIQVGDKLIAVDDQDVRSMTAIKVSKLISKKSANPSRKLTIVRTSLFDDPEG